MCDAASNFITLVGHGGIGDGIRLLDLNFFPIPSTSSNQHLQAGRLATRLEIPVRMVPQNLGRLMV